MTFEHFGEPKWMTWLRRLATSFRIGQFFGVQVRMYWIALVLMPLFAWSMYSRVGLPAGQAFLMGLLFCVGLFVVIYSHEMSHIVAGWRYGIRTPLITLSPLGGLAHMSAPAPGPKADIVISAAGPAVHLLWLAVLWPLSIWVPPGTVQPAGWVMDPVGGSIRVLRDMNLGLMIFNLLPFFPMDGGRILRAALSMRMHANRASLIAARLGMVGAVLIALAGFLFESLWFGIFLAIGISNFLECRREVRSARWGAGPFGERREAWESDPDAWKGTSPSPPSHRAQRRARRAADQRVRDEAELDRLLDRVNEVGMAGLTGRERQALKRLSQGRGG